MDLTDFAVYQSESGSAAIYILSGSEKALSMYSKIVAEFEKIGNTSKIDSAAYNKISAESGVVTSAVIRVDGTVIVVSDSTERAREFIKLLGY